MILDAEFRKFIQGELSTSNYCCRLKAMVDTLGDLGDAILDHMLLLVVLLGLNSRFAHMSSLLKQQRPFPTFTEVRNDMKLEEIEMPARPSSSTSVLIATTAIAGHAASPIAAPAPRPLTLSALAKLSNFSNSKNNNRRNYTKNMCLYTSFPTTANSWNGTLQLWSAPLSLVSLALIRVVNSLSDRKRSRRRCCQALLF
jgi:hypothetical protein